MDSGYKLVQSGTSALRGDPSNSVPFDPDTAYNIGASPLVSPPTSNMIRHGFYSYSSDGCRAVYVAGVGLEVSQETVTEYAAKQFDLAAKASIEGVEKHAEGLRAKGAALRKAAELLRENPEYATLLELNRQGYL